MSDPCKKCGMWPEDATWWDKIPAAERGFVAVGLAFIGFLAFIMLMAVL